MYSSSLKVTGNGSTVPDHMNWVQPYLTTTDLWILAADHITCLGGIALVLLPGDKKRSATHVKIMPFYQSVERNFTKKMPGA
jgi:hypothetical protein